MRREPNGGEERRPRGEDREEQEGGEGAAQQGQQGQRAPRPSSGSQQRPAPRNVGYVGKHRLSAAIARLDQELQSLQEELNELETMEPASTACQEVIISTEGKPDPLLPITSGPDNSSWDRWFQRVRSSGSKKWWASRGSDFS